MNKRWLRVVPVLAAVLSLTLVAGACGDDDGDEDGGDTPEPTAATPAATDDGTPAEGAIGVSLTEFNVVADPTSAAAGSVTFNVDNLGAEVHEFVIIKTDLAEDALPTAADGSVDEAGAGIEVVDEIEDIAAEGSGEVTVDLEAGSYVLICNIVEEDVTPPESHYQEGMHTAFTVE